MKIRPLMFPTFLVFGWLATVAVFADSKPNIPDPTATAIEQAVLAANEKMTQAANSLNADAFFEYIIDSDKGVIIQNGALFKTRQEALEAVKRGFTGITKLERHIDNPLITVVSPDLAVLAGEGNTIATLVDGRVMTNHFAVSLIFQRKDGQWKVLQGHYSTPIKM